ncbi:MAG: hypothetical protein HYY09_09070 [Firmicutes bacterium]|nr:hypothetical protein [Bacillota bacterium]
MPEPNFREELRIHDQLAADWHGDRVIRCRQCGHAFGSLFQNYKERALLRVRKPWEYLPDRRPGEFVEYWEFYCPGCGVLLAVDPMGPGDRKPTWDIRIASPPEE